MPNPSNIRFFVDRSSPLAPLEQVRDQLVANMHLGLLPAGSRLPAVRELALAAGVNLKTAFRIYRGLADAGLVEIRPQRGVFVKSSERAGKLTHRAGISAFLDRIQRDAQRYNLSPVRVSQMLAARAGMPSAMPLRCAFLECNKEQADVFTAELRRRLGLDVFPVLTGGPARPRERVLGDADVFITTFYHREEVSRWSAQLHKETFCIRLNPEFHRTLLRFGRRGLFPMVMSDVTYEPRFRRVMKRLIPAKVLDRLVLVHHGSRKRVAELLAQVSHAYVSPLVYDEVRAYAPDNVELITLREMISHDSIQQLRRALVSGKE